MAAKMVVPLIFTLFLQLHFTGAQTWIKAGLWFSTYGLPVPEINSALFTHLLCGYVGGLNSSTYQLAISSSDEDYFSTFTGIVKEKNPTITTMLSIWGGNVNSSTFPRMTSKSSYRKAFIESSIRIARLYNFHGFNIDGVEPTTESNMTNLRNFLDELRAAVDSESANSSKSRLILAMNVYYLPTVKSVSYPVDSMQKNLDFVIVKAYDYYMPFRDNFTAPPAALYDPYSNVSTDFGVTEWISKGLAANKMVLSLPYFGTTWSLVNSEHSGIGAAASSIPPITATGSISYKDIIPLIQSYKATSEYNSTFVVNYCRIQSAWIAFDDVEAIKTKVSYAKEKKLLGYHAFEVSMDYNWMLSRAAAQEVDKDPSKKQLLVIVLLPVAGVILLLGLLICYLRRRVHKSKGILSADTKSISKAGTAPSLAAGKKLINNNDPNLQVFSFSEIKAATNNFSNANKLGEGGFGPVYKGKLLEGQEIAVKRLSRTSKQGAIEFQNEVTLTAKLQHVNLVRVLGFCTGREEKMLIYEHMPNKSLDFYIFDPVKRFLLDWEKRIHIIEGVTQGLLYLQEYSRLTIIHRDLKASNILLDNDMRPKISDFGMARIFEKDDHATNTNQIVGTYGYVPPECVKKGAYSMKSDVFSFGVLLLQIISGKKNNCTFGSDQNLNLLEYAYDLWTDGKGMEFKDPSLDDATSSCKLMRCMQIALLCVQEKPVDRPSMLEVYLMLKNETAVITTPGRPAFSIKINEDKEYKTISQHEIISSNGTTFSEMLPR